MNLAIFFPVCLFCFCLDSAYTGKSTCIPELLLKLSDTLHKQYKYTEHVNEEVSGKILLFLQNGCLSKLAILYDMCIDSAYAGNSTCTTVCAATIQHLAYKI